MHEPRAFRSALPDLSQVPFARLTALEDPELARALRVLAEAVRKPYGPLRGDSQNEEMAADPRRSGTRGAHPSS
ncbi:hypothetical protein GCM10022295_88330 [Streptomyces osmaniensis]|uniref:FXSXX-COOH protein n=1 Tax=Streptomyces osmaniensis TaxID=593134 RepID=A0ABP6YZ22_9ACTN